MIILTLTFFLLACSPFSWSSISPVHPGPGQQGAWSSDGSPFCLRSHILQVINQLIISHFEIIKSYLKLFSLIYFAEKESAARWTFPDSFWWGLMVLTTVGYGDRAPDSAVGQLIGGFCALLGVFILALPVPIIVNSFSENYKNRVWKGQMMMKRKDRENDNKNKINTRFSFK